MKITVTQVHIDKGRPGHACSCPVALAIRDAWPTPFAEVCVGVVGDVRVNGEWHLLPTAARVFVANFDASAPVQPFEFDLGDKA